MQSISLNSSIEKNWERLSGIVRDAVVYLDDGTAECFHWNGGLEKIQKYGARLVKRFEISKSFSDYWDEVVFILNGPIGTEASDVLKGILSNSQFIKCTVVTSDPEGGSQNNPYSDLKKDLLEWMGSKKFEATVICLPVSVACVSPHLFLLPPFAKLFPPLDTADPLEAKKIRSTSTPDDISIKLLGFSLNHLFENLNITEDIFVWGQLSHAVGMEVLKHRNTKHRKKGQASQRASVLLLDRTLDLSACLSQQCDCLFDSVVRTLPSFPGHSSCDVAINMAPLLYPDAALLNRSSSGLPNGCLAGLGKSSVLDVMISSKAKEGLIEINRQLVLAANKEGISVKVEGGRITPDSLLQKTQAFSKPASIWEYQELLQQSLAVIESLKSPLYEKSALLLSTERLLVQNLLASQEGPTRNLLHIISHRIERNMQVQDILLLLAHLFSVTDDTVWRHDDETKLQGALAEAIFQELEELPLYLKAMIGDITQESQILSAISQTFKILKVISRSRQNFKKYKTVLRQEDPALPATYNSVFQQLLKDVLDSNRPDIPDLQCISTGISDMLKSGLGLFMNVQKPHPQDNPLLVVIVLGGVTGSEVKAMRGLVASSKKRPQIIIGSNRICKPVDILESVFRL